MNELADDDKLRAITYRINGGFTNYADRETELARAKSIWGDAGDAMSRIVDRGDFDDNVRRLQLLLVEHGLLTGTVDGKFGFNTYKALFEFKTRMDLIGAGYADVATFRALQEDTWPLVETAVEDFVNLPKIGHEPEPVRCGISLESDG